ncbi:hypothetical protein DFR48_110164 [Ciceribacter lividus]|uniref:Uncharacterized protein n=1 Tax=Ciceribacter lividus TaxID=1197950 RepID=A0A6I7HJI5_9HYPH|nr:hypothetical protein [Ciceribacter lividus]RCW21575.1 hypothetical protein DFR48_110164 [Ciceribacter lividus]
MIKKVSLRLDEMQPVQRVANASGFSANWSGGVQATQADEHRWRILPVLTGGRPCVNGFYSKSAMQQFLLERGLQFVAFERMNWIDGAYTSFWSPRIPGQTNFFRGPADLWHSMSSNIGQVRGKPQLAALSNPTLEQLAEILDARTEPERLAQSIALSLRNVDTSVRGIFEFYHEELTNLLAHGQTDGTSSASMRDQVLFAHIHAFFLHLGSARDYLAALIAFRLGHDPHNVDSLTKLLKVIGAADVTGEPLLELLSSRGCIAPRRNNSSKFEQAGWLWQATDQRNELTHRRTFGDLFSERRGHLTAVDLDDGLYRYVRPLGGSYPADDTLDAILEHYANVNELFFTAAGVAGYDASIRTLTDDDIVSVQEQS